VARAYALGRQSTRCIDRIQRTAVARIGVQQHIEPALHEIHGHRTSAVTGAQDGNRRAMAGGRAGK
jgi:hypothetical protein